MVEPENNSIRGNFYEAYRARTVDCGVLAAVAAAGIGAVVLLRYFAGCYLGRA